MLTLLLLLIAYLVGSISSAVIVCRLQGLPDPRTQGSHNAGATNVLRLGGKSAAAMVLAGDLLKGLLVVLLAKWLGLSNMAVGFVGLAAVVGHVFPVFYQFKGGKGVATALGVIFGINVILGILAALIWFAVAKLTRYVSVASLIAIAAAPWIGLFIISRSYFIPLFLISLLVFIKHWDNITRLRQGSEATIEENHKARTR
jgi:glycerol-3-phosphate acyltransferase PlsY